MVKGRTVISEGCGERKIQILEVSPKAAEKMYKERKINNNNSLLDRFQTLRVSINVKPKWPVCKMAHLQTATIYYSFVSLSPLKELRSNLRNLAVNVFVCDAHEYLDSDESSIGPEEIGVPHPSFFAKDNEFH